MMDPLTISVPRGHFFEGQLPHLLLLAALLPGAWAIASPVLGDGAWLGVEDRDWFFAAVAVAVVHQLVVALLWRAQLCFGTLSRLFGRFDLVAWGAIFLPLLVARPLLLIGLAVADHGSLRLPPAAAVGGGVLLLVPAVYALYSVVRYFGTARALGGDHFRERYRVMPMVRRGAFRFTSNAMYGVAFLGLWAIALFGNSQAALAVALFQHAYIWVHMFCTEGPDLRVLYPVGA